MEGKILYHGKIDKVRFSTLGDEEVKKNSFVQVTSYDLFRNNMPYAEGVYDARMGTTDHSYPCQSCYNDKKLCLGHSGHVNLNYPVFAPVAMVDTKKWLKLICFKCGHPIVEESLWSKFPRRSRLDEASKMARGSNKKCCHCGELHPIVKKDETVPDMLSAVFMEEKKVVQRYMLYPHIVKLCLDKITDQTVLSLGKHPDSHPRKFVLTKINVPPTSIRPDVKKMTGGRSTNDDATSMLQFIVKKNLSMPKVLPETIDKKTSDAIIGLNHAYYDFVKGGSNGSRSVKSGSQPLVSMAARLRSKRGLFRKNMLGKRARSMGRSTITGDPSLKPWEVGVPLEFAKNLQYVETVQEYNRARLSTYVSNGLKKYPGSTKVVKKSTGSEYGVGTVEIELEYGDKVYRDMITGDPINFNRQPSLKLSNISAMRAVVIEDPTLLTLRMNVVSCVLNRRGPIGRC